MGSALGQENLNLSLPLCSVSSAPEPPPEKATSVTAALGAQVPSARRTSAVSIGTHLPRCSVRCGIEESVR
ncbi:hypothetical protein [Streptomyces sp. NPDC093261]|uniref:hypothetical protein n=1 Tax=Streptomyces sp. NPDC093261 TaxID=3366037 RepID=UPI00382D3728